MPRTLKNLKKYLDKLLILHLIIFFNMKIGFEIHQQLNTNKLFCNCPSELREDKPELRIIRRLRPTQSELGEIDRAALEEFLKGKYYEYEIYNENVCLVETDEEPPHIPNKEAIDIALEIALLLNANIVDELHFMRKLVIDGSNTSGFQRTAIIAMDGYVDTKEGRVGIPTICLEEEAARKISEEGRKVVYRLDRLGIPLVEISTAPDIKTPEQAREVALKIGEMLRATGKVKRGIGTIRQDINVSIEGGARVEIKGVQDLNLIPKIIQIEAERQRKLIEIKEELKKRKAKVDPSIVEVSHLFENTACKIIKKVRKVFALRLRGFKGLLKNKLGPEFAAYAKVASGVGGIFHSDELPAYGISKEEVEKVSEELDLGKEDAFVLIVAKEEKAKKALNAVLKRARLAFEGVPEETRVAKQDGSTAYMRPLPGAARMYPETDIPPIVIDKKRIERIKASLPELFEEKTERFIKEYGLSKELAYQIARSEHSDFFESLAKRMKLSPKIIASTLVSTLKELKREGYEIERLSYEDLTRVLRFVEKGKIAKEAIPEVLIKVIETGKFEIEITTMSEEEISKLIRKILNERKDFVFEKGMYSAKPLMGVVMKEVRGKVDGKKVMEILTRELKSFLEGK